jgi:hypothetical protein
MSCCKGWDLAFGIVLKGVLSSTGRPVILLLLQEARALVGWGAAVLWKLDVEATRKAVVKLLECQVSGSTACWSGLSKQLPG